MKSLKLIIVSGILFTFIVTLLFSNILYDYKQQKKIIQRELIGIKKIIFLHDLNLSLKVLRGLTQLKTDARNRIKKILMIDENEVLRKLKKLDDKSLGDFFKNINTYNYQNSLQLFNQYTWLIKKIDIIRLETSEKYFLFFEHNRQSYYLMVLFSSKIPEAIEYLGRIRGLTTGVLSGKSDFNNVKIRIEININNFTNKISEIKYFISKLPIEKATLLNEQLTLAMSNFYKLQNEIKKIPENRCELRPEGFFLAASKLINNFNNLFILTEKILEKNLLKLMRQISLKLWLNLAVFIIIILFGIIATIKFYFKVKKEIILDKKLEDEERFKKILTDDFMSSNSLKDLCYKLLNNLVEYFKAVNGTIYIFDDKNYKLYLGAVYGIEEKKIKKTLNIHDNIIGEVINSKKSRIIEINQNVNLGNISIKTSYLVTLPLFELQQCIGAIQLLFDERFLEVDFKFLENIVNLIASYIFKAQKDEIVKKYLGLVDKHVLISKTDYEGIIVDVSTFFCELTGYAKEELIGKTHSVIHHPDTPDELIKDLWDTIKGGEVWTGEIKNKKKNGEEFWVYTIITPDYDINGNIIGFTAIRNDITDKKYIEKISITDGLTSLYNRRHFDKIFPKELKIARRINKKIAFAMIDIDKFKQFNDIYGHQAGDEALKKVAFALKNAMKRADDYAFRLGGEEFGMLFKVKDCNDALELCENVRITVENLKIDHKGNTATKFLTISMGVAIINPEKDITIDEIYRLTDLALYEAKKGGRNQVKLVELN